MYYLQHPTTPEQVASFTPKVKRKLDIGPLFRKSPTAWQEAVQWGTARSLKANFVEMPVLGKTGTCSKDGTRFGWFGSFANTQYGRIVTVVFLEGGVRRWAQGGRADRNMYRNLYDHDYFAAKNPATEAQRTGPAVNGAQQ